MFARPSRWRRQLVVAAGFGLWFGVYATPAAAIFNPYLHVGATGDIVVPGVGSHASHLQNAATGPLLADVEAGVVLAYRYPDHFPDFELETTLYARAKALADYGTNRAAVELNFRPTNGTDRGAYPASMYYGGLPNQSSAEPHAFAQSIWTDTFVIEGGTGVGTATVSVALHGHAESRYGANGTIWYDAEPSFQTFGTSGFGSAQYRLNISYDDLPPGLDEEFPAPISWNQSFSSPLPAFVVGDIPTEILTGSFVFEYGVPFGLSSFLTLFGDNQINIDFDHTATLSLFDLPEGASLTSGSGHNYPVPEPATWVLMVIGMAACAGFRRRRRR